MANNSPIEWTDATWNPVVGCSIVSPGCTNCYAMKMASRIEAMGNQPRYEGTTRKVNGNAIWTGKLAQAPDSVLLAPLKRKKPTTYFVNSMGDLFHEDCPDEWIDRVFAVMAMAPQHTFQVLTKRAARMKAYFERYRGSDDHNCADMIADAAAVLLGKPGARGADRYSGQSPGWPLPNVWLGVSTERQQEADKRIPLLLQTPAAVRFISAEPLLGPLDLRAWLSDDDGCEGCDDGVMGQPNRCARTDIPRDQQCPRNRAVFDFDEGPLDADGAPAWMRERRVVLDWVIVGGESGPNSRAMHPDWARSLRDQCAAAGVAFFFKQWGAWVPHKINPGDDLGGDVRCGTVRIVHPTGRSEVEVFEATGGRNTEPGSKYMRLAGKKVAGRHLDGVLHDAMPQRARGGL